MAQPLASRIALFDFPPPAPVLSFADALLGAAAGSGLLWLVSEAYFRLRGREGMGLGDVKMMLMAGAFLGVKRTLLTIFAGSILGSILGVAVILARRKGFRLRIAIWNFSRHGRVTGGIFRHAGCILVSIAADGAMMTKCGILRSEDDFLAIRSHAPAPQPFDFGSSPAGRGSASASFAFRYFLRKFLRRESAALSRGDGPPKPDTENASAFMAASMQGVIEKLRTQEKELARLHLVAQERAQESERLTEEVTRNMPTGLLLVNATGAISTTNPAAEEALGIRTLRYRSYKEILGADSDLTRMLTACLRDGQNLSARRSGTRYRRR